MGGLCCSLIFYFFNRILLKVVSQLSLSDERKTNFNQSNTFEKLENNNKQDEFDRRDNDDKQDDENNRFSGLISRIKKERDEDDREY